MAPQEQLKHFIGIPIPEPYRGQFRTIRQKWQYRDQSPYRHTEPHITLFPPFWAESELTWINELRATISKFDSFEAELSTVGAFDNRVVYSKVVSDVLSRVHDSTKEVLFKHILSAPRLNEHYRPHVTLAINRKEFQAAELRKLKLETQLLLKLPQKIIVNRVRIYAKRAETDPYFTYTDIALE